MVYYDLHTILAGVGQAAFFGTIMGVFAIFLNVFLDIAESIFLLPRQVFVASSSLLLAKQVLKKQVRRDIGNGKRFIRDFVYTVVYGISFIFLLYIATDGVFRFYLLIVSLFVTAVFGKFAGKYFKAFISQILSSLTSVLVFSLAVIMLLVRKIIKMAYLSAVGIFCKTVKKLKFKKINSSKKNGRNIKLCKITKIDKQN